MPDTIAPSSASDAEWITPGAAAALLGLTPRRVSDLVDAGQLDGYRRTDGGHRRVKLAAVLARRMGGTTGDAA